MTLLILRPEHQDLISQAAEAVYPGECCGLLIGHGADVIEVTSVVPADNLADSNDRFLIDPQIQFDWLRKLRGTEQRIVGHYHSHPNGRAEPSPFDILSSQEADQVWLIVPMEDGRVADLQAFISGSSPKELSPITLQIQ